MSIKRRKNQIPVFDRTCDALDCIDLTYYINADLADFIEEADTDDILDVMAQIQLDFERDHLPSDAMYILSDPDFHGDVFRAMDDEEFLHYLVAAVKREGNFRSVSLTHEVWQEFDPYEGLSYAGIRLEI